MFVYEEDRGGYDKNAPLHHHHHHHHTERKKREQKNLIDIQKMFQFKIHKDTEKMMMLIVIEKYLEKFFF